jgi:hypothetical protein
MGRYRPTPFSGRIEELSAYVARELEAVSTALEAATGGTTLIRSATAGPITADVTPQVLTFEESVPERDAFNVLPNLPSELVGRRAGLWGVAFVVNARVAVAGQYRVAVYAGGQESYLVSDVDPSNQSTLVSFVAVGAARADGTEGPTSITIDLRVTADQERSFEFLQGTFTAWRIGA